VKIPIRSIIEKANSIISHTIMISRYLSYPTGKPRTNTQKWWSWEKRCM